MRWVVLILFVVCAHIACAKIYYVGGDGASDSNPGTAAQPFATIQKAASVAVAGDIVNIRSGNYRETISLPTPEPREIPSSFGLTAVQLLPSVDSIPPKVDGVCIMAIFIKRALPFLLMDIITQLRITPRCWPIRYLKMA